MTGDSYIVHTMPVVGAAGAAAYLAKYVRKSFGAEKRMAEFGMSRRWSTSKGWPGSGALKLQQVEWSLIQHYPGHYCDEEASNDPVLLTRQGTDVALALAQRRANRRGSGVLRKVKG